MYKTNMSTERQGVVHDLMTSDDGDSDLRAGGRAGDLTKNIIHAGNSLYTATWPAN